MDIIWKLYA